jgi:hypothetical protein
MLPVVSTSALWFLAETSHTMSREVVMDDRFDAALAVALLGFEGEAGQYCQGISDTPTREYAEQYARMLRDRAMGLSPKFPYVPAGLFGPNRNLIGLTLDRLWQKYSPAAK